MCRVCTVCTFKCIQMLGSAGETSATPSARYRSMGRSSDCRMSSGLCTRLGFACKAVLSPCVHIVKRFSVSLSLSPSNFSSFVYRKDPIFAFGATSLRSCDLMQARLAQGHDFRVPFCHSQTQVRGKLVRFTHVRDSGTTSEL